jgi:sulfur carrier protein
MNDHRDISTSSPGPASTGTISVVVGGDVVRMPAASTVHDLLQQLNVDVRRVAVERNRQVVRRIHHATTALADGDQLEIVGFVGGG